MKKILKMIFVLIVIFSTRNVYAENKLIHNKEIFPIRSWTIKENDLIPNDSYFTELSDYDIQTGNYVYYDLVFNFYDENGEFLESNTPPIETVETDDEYIIRYIGKDLYHLDSSYSLLWRIHSIRAEGNNYIIDFYKVPLEENQNVYTFRMFFDYENAKELLIKRGDIAIYTANAGASINYVSNGRIDSQYEDYYVYGFDYSKSYGYFKVGYEIENQNKKIETLLDEYLVSFNGISSGGSYFRFLEYKNPEFYITCDKTELRNNEKINCSMNMKSIFALNKINIQIPKNNNYIIDNIQSKEELYYFDMEEDTIKLTNIEYDNYYQELIRRCLYYNSEEQCANLEISDGLENYKLKDFMDVELFTFTFQSTNSINALNELSSMFDINYSVASMNDTTIANKNFKLIDLINPKTYSSIIMIAIVSITIIVFIVLHRKNLLKEI